MNSQPAKLRNLPRLAELLAAAGFHILLPAAGEQAQLQIVAELGENLPAGCPLRLFYQEDLLILAEPSDSQLAPELEDSATLCFELELQRPLPTERLLELYRLLNAWNGQLPLGTLGVQEAEPSGIYYRYALPHDEAFNPMLVAEILDQLGFYLNRLLPLLDQWLAEGGEIEATLQASERELALEALSQIQREAGGLD